MKTLKSLLITVALSIAASSLAQDTKVYSVQPKFDPQVPVVVGDQVSLEVKELGTEAVQVEPALEGDVPQQLFDQGWRLITVEGSQVVLAPVKSGKLETPKFRIKNSDGQIVGETSSISVQVTSTLTPEDRQNKEAEKLKPPVAVEFPVIAWILMGLFVLLVLGVSIFALIRWLMKRQKSSALPDLDRRMEDEIALDHLRKLVNEGYLAKGDFKRHYFRLTEILKIYIGARFRFEAVESTTEELIARFESDKKVSDSAVDQLETLLQRLDRVKFTDFIPTLAEANATVEDARKWISMTRRAGTTSEGAKNAI